ncbi:MAG TPA: DUF721 domain-containing protein [Clostridia bacterium]|nr:DUF721 domain-containing protein [Clostridia bacterium]
MKRTDNSMERIGEVIDEMRRTGRLDKGIKVQSLGDVWPAVQSLWSERTIGAYVARNSHPAQFRNGTLTILCANPSIMQVLAEQKALIVERLNAHMGGKLVTDLSFGLDNVHEVRIIRPQAASPVVQPDLDSLAVIIQLNPEQKARAEKAVQVIQNPALRLSFLHAYEAWLRWDIWRHQEQQKRRKNRTTSRKY